MSFLKRNNRPDVKTGEINFYEAPINKVYQIEVVPSTALLPCLGIYPKSVVTKTYRYRWGGPIMVKVGQREVAIGKDVANRILVKEYHHD